MLRGLPPAAGLLPAAGSTELAPSLVLLIPRLKRFRIVVGAQTARSRQRTANSTYLVSGKDMSSQMKYIHAAAARFSPLLR